MRSPFCVENPFIIPPDFSSSPLISYSHHPAPVRRGRARARGRFFGCVIRKYFTACLACSLAPLHARQNVLRWVTRRCMHESRTDKRIRTHTHKALLMTMCRTHDDLVKTTPLHVTESVCVSIYTNVPLFSFCFFTPPVSHVVHVVDTLFIILLTFARFPPIELPSAQARRIASSRHWLSYGRCLTS